MEIFNFSAIYYLFVMKLLEETCTTTNNNEVIYRDCKDAYSKGATSNGVYLVQPDSLPPFDVYCDMTTYGGGWTVFERRENGSVDFYTEWGEYKNGFGDLNGEFWLGLHKIYRLTNSDTQYQLRIDTTDFNNVREYAQYSSFKIFGFDSEYLLSVSGYSGTAGDSLTSQNGMMFSTKRVDKDIWDEDNCAGPRPGRHGKDGVEWYSNWGYCNLLKLTEMKLQ